MPKIPEAILAKNPPLEGLNVLNRGKVRDTYELPGHPDMLLVGASDRISIFDFVLNGQITDKGAILNAMNLFWRNNVICNLFPSDLIAGGEAIDEYLPHDLCDRPWLQKTHCVVKRYESPPYEDIVRFILVGSGWSSYQKTGTVCGHSLPAGLKEGDELPFPIYTPTTKAKTGHDEHVLVDDVIRKAGWLRERQAIQIASLIHKYAASRGVLFADTKFEFCSRDGILALIDEVGTPDSSRFLDFAAWKKANAAGKLPPSLDKQFVREWGKSVGITGKLDPEVDADVALAHSQQLPEDVAKMTSRLYRYIFWRLTGKRLENFQRGEMGITTDTPKRHIEILVGSKSDLDQIEAGLGLLADQTYNVSVISCHRNPFELMEAAGDRLAKADVVIAGAGKAAALPGVVKSFLCKAGHSHIPVIGVAFEGSSAKSNDAARLSIEDLPEQPVELDPNGCAYFGRQGFREAAVAAVNAEFLPRHMAAKPVDMDVIRHPPAA